jgi:hypothetical protein
MGNHFQSIVDPEATEAEAPALADRVLRWLIAEQIVVPERTDCVLSESGGYAPGPAYVKATGAPDVHVLTLRTNGMEVVSTRTVFHSGEGDLELICGTCGSRIEPKQGWWADAVGEWYDRAGPGMLACPVCGISRPVTEWQHDPPLGFGNLGFTFWNWPMLTDDFVASVGKLLGNRVLDVAGHL